MIKTIKYQPSNDIWDVPFLPPIASEIAGAKETSRKISTRVSGEWKFRMETIDNITDPHEKSQNFDFSAITDGWEDVIVPSSLIMQGYNIQNNTEYYYKKTIIASGADKNLRSFVRFEGVYCNARIWLNGEHVCTHLGGFTPFDIELTDYLKADKSCEIVIGIADIESKKVGTWNKDGGSMSNASWGSYYAHNNICGILRDVTLYYLPKSYLLSNHIKSDLTENYSKGRLSLDLQFVCGDVSTTSFNITLTGNGGNLAFRQTVSCSQCAKIEAEVLTKKYDIGIDSHTYANIINKAKDKKYSRQHVPFKRCAVGGELYGLSILCDSLGVLPWTAETPELYSLEVELLQNGESVCVYSEQVGFRSLEYGGMGGGDKNKIYVNGKEIKLRGVCRHDISSKYGRSLTQEDEEKEIISFKNNNINHVRTSHYPASKNYLRLCDKYGIYVEQENSVCFKGGNGYELLCAPEEILQSLSEMVEFYYNHPSIIMWSSGNESGFEKSVAFRRSFDYLKEKDPARPTIFSYPFTVKSKPLPYDIFSKHYMKVTKFLGNKKSPKLHDEFAHVACYNLDDIVSDNNYRLFWGKSILKGWENMLKDDGALGCAIWGGIDDVFYLPKGVESAHQRHSSMQAVGYGEWGAVLDVYKREKPEAYLTKKAFSMVRLKDYSAKGGVLTMKIANNFDHVNLGQVLCVINDSKGNCLFSGGLPCDIQPKRTGTVEFKLPVDNFNNAVVIFYFGGFEVDREVLYPTSAVDTNKNVVADNFALEPTANGVELRVGEDTLIGDIVFMRNAKPMKALSRSVTPKDNSTCKKLVVTDKFGGLRSVKYTLERVPEGVLVGVRMSPALIATVGDRIAVGFDLKTGVKAVSWDKNCDYTYYPEEHLERSVGTANVAPSEPNAYGIEPSNPWKEDGYNYFTGISTEQERVFVTNDFKTTRTDINNYAVKFSSCDLNVKKLKDTINCYTSFAPEKSFIDSSDAQIVKSGSWRLIRKYSSKQCSVSRKKSSTMSIEFSGVGIKIFGTRSKEQGKISLYVDDALCKVVDTRSDICDVLDFMVLDTVSDLANGKHKLTIALNDDMGVRISGFEVISAGGVAVSSRLSVGIGSYYRSLAWGNYYGKRMTVKQKRGFSFLLTPHKSK